MKQQKRPPRGKRPNSGRPRQEPAARPKEKPVQYDFETDTYYSADGTAYDEDPTLYDDYTSQYIGGPQYAEEPPQPVYSRPNRQAASAPVRNRYADRMNRKKRMPKRLKILLGVLALVLLGGGVFFLTRDKEETIVTEDTAFSSIGFLETYVEGYGQTAAKRREELGKDIKGVVSEVLATPGDEVKEGDVLMIIDPVDTRKELDEAMEAAEEARKSVESAERGVRSASEDVAKLNVTAPFAGKLVPADDEKGEINIRVGDELSAGTTIGLMVDDSVLRVPLYFSYAYIDSIYEGMPATVSVAYTMTSAPATVEKVEKIERISPDGTKTFRVVLSFDNPGTLTKGMSAIGSVMVDGFSVVPADPGLIEYNRERPVIAESGGKVTNITGLNYYRFSSGQSILRMSNPDLTDALASAQAGVESQQKMYETRQERITELEQLIEESTVRSPIDGIVLSMSAQVDEKLDGTRAPCVVADMTSIVVNASIAELDIDKVQAGQPVTLTMDSGDASAMYTGTVLSVSMQGERDESGRGGSSMSFPIVIAVDENSEQPLAPDRSINYQITTASSMDCVIVPSSAVVYTEEGAAVYAKPAEGQEFENARPAPEGSEVPDGFLLVPVTTGIYDENNTEIVSGIGDGVEVYLAAPQDAYEQYEQQMAVAGIG